MSDTVPWEAPTSTNNSGAGYLSGSGSEKKGIFEKHKIPIFFSIFLAIILIALVFLILTGNITKQVSSLLLTQSQADALFNSGTYYSYTANALQLNASSGSYLSILLGNKTAYVAQFSGGNELFQEFVINRSGVNSLFSGVYANLSRENPSSKIENGSSGNLTYFYMITPENSSYNIINLIGKSNKDIVVFSALYSNLSISNLTKYLSNDVS